MITRHVETFVELTSLQGQEMFLGKVTSQAVFIFLKTGKKEKEGNFKKAAITQAIN